jgi:hypothetical protein
MRAALSKHSIYYSVIFKMLSLEVPQLVSNGFSAPIQSCQTKAITRIDYFHSG